MPISILRTISSDRGLVRIVVFSRNLDKEILNESSYSVVMELTHATLADHQVPYPRTANDLSNSVLIALVLDFGGEGILAFTLSLEEVVNWIPRSLGEMWCWTFHIHVDDGVGEIEA